MRHILIVVINMSPYLVSGEAQLMLREAFCEIEVAWYTSLVHSRLLCDTAELKQPDRISNECDAYEVYIMNLMHKDAAVTYSASVAFCCPAGPTCCCLKASHDFEAEQGTSWK